jgi:hypothetical protein
LCSFRQIEHHPRNFHRPMNKLSLRASLFAIGIDPQGPGARDQRARPEATLRAEEL